MASWTPCSRSLFWQTRSSSGQLLSCCLQNSTEICVAMSLLQRMRAERHVCDGA